MNYRVITSFMISASFLAGCSTVNDFKPVTKNGQEYIYGMPVLATGVVEDVQITEKNGTVHTFAAGASDVIGQGGVGMAAATTAGGMGSVGGGLAGGAIAGVFDFISRANAPKIELMVRRDKEGDIQPLPVSSDSLRILTKYRCVDIGDRIRIVKKGSNGFDVYNANANWLRLSDFQPSCEELKAKVATNGAVGGNSAQAG